MSHRLLLTKLPYKSQDDRYHFQKSCESKIQTLTPVLFFTISGFRSSGMLRLPKTWSRTRCVLQWSTSRQIAHRLPNQQWRSWRPPPSPPPSSLAQPPTLRWRRRTPSPAPTSTSPWRIHQWVWRILWRLEPPSSPVSPTTTSTATASIRNGL